MNFKKIADHAKNNVFKQKSIIAVAPIIIVWIGYLITSAAIQAAPVSTSNPDEARAIIRSVVLFMAIATSISLFFKANEKSPLLFILSLLLAIPLFLLSFALAAKSSLIYGCFSGLYYVLYRLRRIAQDEFIEKIKNEKP